ncbi:MAG: hypothetical protein SCALA701_17680 [Candidatus Scalindua sp.]|nr:MAG: hypothetical protein SCALA701_17680 [Candidatus Scalindua sp.]
MSAQICLDLSTTDVRVQLPLSLSGNVLFLSTVYENNFQFLKKGDYHDSERPNNEEQKKARVHTTQTSTSSFSPSPGSGSTL